MEGERCWLALLLGRCICGGGRRSIADPSAALGMTSQKWAAGFRLEAGAGDVFVFDLGGLLDGVAGQVVGVPDYGFAGDFGVFAQEFEGVGAGGGVVFLVGEFG